MRDVVLRSRLFIEAHQIVGVEFVGLPGLDHIHKARLRRMAVVFQVVLVLRLALDIHAPRIPVAILGRGLRPPVVPHAELGVGKPVRHVVRSERFARSFERTAARWRDSGAKARLCARRRDGHRGALTACGGGQSEVSRNLRRVSVRFICVFSSPVALGQLQSGDLQRINKIAGLFRREGHLQSFRVLRELQRSRDGRATPPS